MFNDRYVEVTLEQYRDIAGGLFKAAGCDDATARVLAEMHLDNDLRGVGVQGMNYLLGIHIPAMLDGLIDPAGKPTVIKEDASYALIDGNRGPGSLAISFAQDIVVKKARLSGVAMAGIRNSADIFRVGLHAEQIAEEGLIGCALSNDAHAYVCACGGAEPVMGSNPMAIAVPTEGTPFVIDFTPSSTIPDWVRYARYYGEQLPEGVATDRDGIPTTDPDAVTDGSEYPTDLGGIDPGGHKGYGMLLALDFLSGALVGADIGLASMAKAVPSKGHLILAIDPAAFVDLGWFKQAVSVRILEMKNSRKAVGVSEIRVPGERSYAQRERSLADNRVRIDEFLWLDLEQLCDRLGLQSPAHL